MAKVYIKSIDDALNMGWRKYRDALYPPNRIHNNWPAIGLHACDKIIEVDLNMINKNGYYNIDNPKDGEGWFSGCNTNLHTDMIVILED